ncbi:SURF1 family protein [Massilia sp. 9096]|uniref:SURF1 family protein n=1 Tax=Massilia sp. 9096 TaxID=1500894 RepID=UPI000A501C09|nr:SURF1 family protein [Massilia sp. 9096]
MALGVLLGNWQTRRAAEKTALQSRLDVRRAAPPLVLGREAVDPAAVEFRRVIVTGEFVPTWPVFLDNRPNGGRSGFVLLMPFKITGADGATNKYVLVERGWLPRRAEYGSVPAFSTPAGPRRIEGIAVLRPARVMQLGAPAPLHPGAIVQNAEPSDIARVTGFDFQPIVLEQTGADIAAGAANGAGSTPLVRNWPAPGVDIARHRGYAVQWYGLATMAFLFYVITGFRRASKPAAA